MIMIPNSENEVHYWIVYLKLRCCTYITQVHDIQRGSREAFMELRLHI